METILILAGIAMLQSPHIIKCEEISLIDKNNALLFKRWLSILLMSPLIFYKSYNLEIQISVMAWFILYFNLNLLLNFLLSLFHKQGSGQISIPHVSLQGQHFSIYIKHAASAIVYLTGFEIILRVILINDLQSGGFSYMQSVVISFAIYVLMHIPQGWKMTIGSVLFGIIATAWIVITGSVLPVIILHIACALGNDFLSSRNPDSSIIKNSFSL